MIPSFSSLHPATSTPGTLKAVTWAEEAIAIQKDLGDKIMEGYAAWHLTSQSLTWNLKINPWNGRFLSDTITFKFHVKLGECNKNGSHKMKATNFGYRILCLGLMNGWFAYSKSPMKRNENDLIQTSMRTCSMLIFRGVPRIRIYRFCPPNSS